MREGSELHDKRMGIDHGRELNGAEKEPMQSVVEGSFKSVDLKVTEDRRTRSLSVRPAFMRMSRT